MPGSLCVSFSGRGAEANAGASRLPRPRETSISSCFSESPVSRDFTPVTSGVVGQWAPADHHCSHLQSLPAARVGVFLVPM